MRDITDILRLQVGLSSIGFVDPRGSTPRSVGSGTLVRFGDAAGILTCAHVVDALADLGEFGVLGFPPREKPKGHAPRITFDYCAPVSIGKGPWSSEGPDLAFVRLPPLFISTLESFATVVNGDRLRAEAFLPEPPCDQIVDVIGGTIAEWIGEPIELGRRAITSFTGLQNIGRAEFRDFSGFDYFMFTATPEQNFILPRSYEGASGGGLWRLYLNAREDGFDEVGARLLGVAFYQTMERQLRGHGPRSVYQVLYGQLT